jgi:hypothetical protein
MVWRGANKGSIPGEIGLQRREEEVGIMEGARTRWTLLFLVVPVLVVLWLIGMSPVSAHHKDGHDHGGGNGNATTVTEDNDGDGVGNTPDPSGNSDNKHPSGADKHAEAGGSVNQGKSASDPDGNGNGGLDKPDGEGGDDIYDQDGNNGCGNDDDFEDDNNGKCGGPAPAVEGPTRPKPDKDRGGKPGGRGGPGPVVLPKALNRPSAEVAAVPVPSAELALTGMDVRPLLLVLVGLVATGTTLLVLGRRRSVTG